MIHTECLSICILTVRLTDFLASYCLHKLYLSSEHPPLHYKAIILLGRLLLTSTMRTWAMFSFQIHPLATIMLWRMLSTVHLSLLLLAPMRIFRYKATEMSMGILVEVNQLKQYDSADAQQNRIIWMLE